MTLSFAEFSGSPHQVNILLIKAQIGELILSSYVAIIVDKDQCYSLQGHDSYMFDFMIINHKSTNQDLSFVMTSDLIWQLM